MSNHTRALLLGTALVLAPAFACPTASNAAASPAGPQRDAPCNETPVEYREICTWLRAKFTDGGNRSVRILHGDTGAGEWKITAVRSHAVYLGRDESRDIALLVHYRDIRMLESDRNGKTTIYLRKEQNP